MFCGCRVNGEQNGSKLKDTIPVLQCRNSIFSKNLLSVCAQETFSLIDHRLFQLLWKWAKRRHPEKGRKWVKDRYWHSKGTRQAASAQIKTVVDNVVFPALDMILVIAFFIKTGAAYFDYRKHGQFEWTAPAILLDRMFLIASAITKAFHGDLAAHTRSMKIGGVEEDTGGSIVHLSQREQKVIIEALVEQRERQEQAMSQTEQLLRRITGSITEYVNAVGMRPLRMSDFDKAILTIQDGALSAFKELYLKVLEAHADDLLVEAAGRPGRVGRTMTLLLLSDAEQFLEPAYRSACQKAIDINDPEKVSFLLEQARGHVPDLSPSFHGEMASYAHLDHRFIAMEIIRQCSEEQIAAAPSRLLEQFAVDSDYRTLSALVEKGISGGTSACRTLHMLTFGGHDNWIAEKLLKKRMWVDTNDYSTLHACIQNDAVDVCKLLLDGGMDFNGYRQWAQTRPCVGHEETLAALAEHWTSLQNEVQKRVSQMDGGMTFV